MKTKHVKYFLLFCLILQEAISFAQTEDTVQLKEVQISSRFVDFSLVQNIRKPDSILHEANSANNLAQLFQSDNGIFVKSYGPSGIGTSSIRGGNASQTAVTWNGLNLKNSMLGETDLSLLSVFLADDISLQYGGSAALWGSGSVAGAIHLRNPVQFNKGTQTSILLTRGSYQNNTTGIRAGFSDKKFSASIRLIMKSGRNNFQFTDDEGDERTLQHAQFVQYGILSENHFRIKTNQVFSFRYWAQLASRNIPPTVQQQVSKSFQKDDFNRLSLEWQLTKKFLKLQARNGFFAERINFSDSVSQLYSHSVCLNNISEAELFFSKNPQHRFQGGLNNTFTTARSDGYDKQVQQNYVSVFAGYLFVSKSEKHGCSVNIREEQTKNKFQPFTFTAGFFSKPRKWLEFKGTFNKLYRLPTLNNLYWSPGGNPSLLPEQGYSEDLTAIFKYKNKDSLSKFSAETQLSAFNRTISNWIIWLPAANGVWSPQNIMEVWSRGMETSSSINFSIRKLSAKIYCNTSYVLSTNEKTRTENDASVGKQLIYTPMYSGAGGIQIKYKQFYFSYYHTYTGYRYLTSDNFDYLNPYDLENFITGYSFRYKNTLFNFNFQLNNAWNTSYRVIAARPMPGANFLAGLKINFVNPPNTNTSSNNTP
jgi:vitamin B12 transporter